MTVIKSIGTGQTLNQLAQNALGMNQSMVNQNNLLMAQAQSMSIYQGGMATAPDHKKSLRLLAKRRLAKMGKSTIKMTNDVGYKDRISAIDRLLDKCYYKSQEHTEAKRELSNWHSYYRHLTGDEAATIFKDYAPVYNGQPKELPMLLLQGLAGNIYGYHEGMLKLTGLFFALPALRGVRRDCVRTSAAGLLLLDYWADKHPKFKKFLDAYDDSKQRDYINLTCVDFAFCIEPASLKAHLVKVKQYQMAWEARQFRKQKANHDKVMAEAVKTSAEYERMRMQIEYEKHQMEMEAQRQRLMYPLYGSTGDTSSLQSGILTAAGGLLNGRK